MVKVLPYGKTDKARYSFSDEFMRALWQKLWMQGTDTLLFRDRDNFSENDWLEFVKSPGSMVFVVVQGLKVAGFCWLTDFVGKTAHMHFVCFKEHWGKDTKEIGREVLHYIFGLRKDDKYLLEELIGYTPDDNHPALEFAKAMGAQVQHSDRPGQARVCVYRESYEDL